MGARHDCPVGVLDNFGVVETMTCAPAEASPQGTPAGGPLGLVSYTTTQTRGVRPAEAHPITAFEKDLQASRTAKRLEAVVDLDTRQSRLKKMAIAVRTAARLHCEAWGNDTNKYKCFMWTLTYADPEAWRPNHIQGFLTAVRMWAKRKGIPCRYAWVAEVQPERLKKFGDSVVHYHVLVWVPMLTYVPHPDKKKWWRHGCTNTKKVFAAVKYAVKYTSKGTSEFEHFPSGARSYGVGGLDAPQRNERMWWGMPKFVREQTAIEDAPRRCKGGGFLIRSSGEILQSPWLMLGIFKGVVRLILRADHEAQMAASFSRGSA